MNPENPQFNGLPQAVDILNKVAKKAASDNDYYFSVKHKKYESEDALRNLESSNDHLDEIIGRCQTKDLIGHIKGTDNPHSFVTVEALINRKDVSDTDRQQLIMHPNDDVSHEASRSSNESKALHALTHGSCWLCNRDRHYGN